MNIKNDLIIFSSRFLLVFELLKNNRFGDWFVLEISC